MSTKIFTVLFRKNLENPKHFHLYPSHRSLDKNPFFTKFGDDGKSKVSCGELCKDHLIFEAIGATEELNAYIGLAREYVRDDEKLTPLAEKLRKIQLVLVDVMEIVSCLQPKESFIDKSKPPKPMSTAKITNTDIADLEAHISHYGALLPPIEKIVIPAKDVRQQQQNEWNDAEQCEKEKSQQEKKKKLRRHKKKKATTAAEEKLQHQEKKRCKTDKGVMRSKEGGGKASAALHVARSLCRRCERVLVSAFKGMDCEKDLLAYINRLSTYLSQAARISAKFSSRSETIYKPHVKGDCTKSDK